MTYQEVLIERLVDIGYKLENASDLVEMYEHNNRLPQLESYVRLKETLRSEI